MTDTNARVQRMAETHEEWAAGLFAALDAFEQGDGPQTVDGEELATEDDVLDRLDPYGRSVERIVSLVLAGGGPSFRLEVTLDDDGDVTEVYGVASWGFEAVRSRFFEGSALWRYAEMHTSDYGRMREAGE